MIVSNVRNKCFAMNYSESFFKFWCFPWYELHPSSSHWSDTTGTYTHTSFPRQFWLWKKITKCLNRLLCIAFDDKTWNISFLYLSNTARKPTVVLGWQWRSFRPVGLQNKFDSVSQALVRQLCFYVVWNFIYSSNCDVQRNFSGFVDQSHPNYLLQVNPCW